MSQEDTLVEAPSVTAEEAATEATEAAEESPQTFDRKYVEKLRNENAAARKRAQDAEARAKEYEDRDKSAAEKAAERATALEKENASLKLESIKTKVALKLGLPEDLIGRLRGDNQEELEADAAQLLEFMRPAEQPAKPPPSFDGGVQPPTPAAPKDPQDAHNDFILRATGRAQN
jgi:hypothetical protein